MNATCSPRWHVSACALCAGMACAASESRAQSLADTGQWESPLTCWPDGSMHANHVVIRDGQNQLTGRILMWYSPGCPFTAETGNCGTWDPPLPGYGRSR